MMFRTNIVALVGGGKSPKWPNHKLILWDDHQQKPIGELTFASDLVLALNDGIDYEVKAVKLRQDKIVVALLEKVYVYNFVDLRLIDSFATCMNPSGLCALNPDTTVAVLATPHTVKGQVKVDKFSGGKQDKMII